MQGETSQTGQPQAPRAPGGAERGTARALERVKRIRSALLGELDRLSALLSTWASGIFHAQDANLSAAEQSERAARAAMSADVA